jgi:molybdate transport system substrate-binding protein
MLKKISLGLSVLLPAQISGGVAQADELRLMALQSPQLVLNEVGSEFQRRTGHKIVQLASPNEMPIHIRQKIEAGQAFDAAFLVPTMLDQLAKEGRIDPGTRVNFLRVPIGVAVRVGSPRPDISSVDAFRRTVLKAKSIAYLKAGISGPHLQRLFERFGIAGELQMKSVRPETDTVGELVAQGAAEIGITAISTLMATSGVDVVGPIPQELQAYVSFQGAVSKNAYQPSTARKLLDFIAEPDVAAVIRRKGMEPWGQEGDGR